MGPPSQGGDGDGSQASSQANGGSGRPAGTDGSSHACAVDAGSGGNGDSTRASDPGPRRPWALTDVEEHGIIGHGMTGLVVSGRSVVKFVVPSNNQSAQQSCALFPASKQLIYLFAARPMAIYQPGLSGSPRVSLVPYPWRMCPCVFTSGSCDVMGVGSSH